MNQTNHIEKPELLGLGTKSKPALQEEDRKRIEKVPAIDETSDGHEAGPSRQTIVQEDTEDTEDQPIGDAKIDDDLSTLIGAKMTTTETTTATMTQQTLEALIRGGGPVQEDNLMRPSAAIADEVRNLQGQNCMDKEGENPQMISDLQHKHSEQADDQEEEEDPLAEEDAREDHQARQEVDHPMGHPEEITTEIGMILKETTRAAT